MREICVLGAGTAALAFIERIKAKSPQQKIRLIDNKSYYFNKKEFISNLSLGGYFDLRNWAQGKGIEFIQDSVERINPTRKKIYFKENDSIDFDVLVVATGLKSKKLPMKGEHREGFFYLSQMRPAEVKDLLKVSCEATVYASTVLGCRLALALNSLGKEVKIVAEGWDFFAQDLERIVAFLQDKGMPVYRDCVIEEAIGEAQVKAVKISPLKVFSSQLVFVDSGLLPNNDFFQDGINIHDIFFTNYENLYFLGDVNCKNISNEFFFQYNHEEAKKQGAVLADFVLEGTLAFFERKVIEEQVKKDVIEQILGESEVKL
ncbi:MAG: FAD-dependent oxidoreductase [Candidatus Omnitrophota bacterium]|nr:MAG: FAD-dependent oxidoreductase [Candidatus Omnitrophota bacterium]